MQELISGKKLTPDLSDERRLLILCHLHYYAVGTLIPCVSDIEARTRKRENFKNRLLSVDGTTLRRVTVSGTHSLVQDGRRETHSNLRLGSRGP